MTKNMRPTPPRPVLSVGGYLIHNTKTGTVKYSKSTTWFLPAFHNGLINRIRLAFWRFKVRHFHTVKEKAK